MQEPFIEKPSLKDIFSLPVLFEKAIVSDFAFYTDMVKKRILQKNSVHRLFIARLRKKRILFVAKINNECVGLIIASHNANIGIVHWLFVLPQHRSKKIGSSLLRKAEQSMKDLGCHKITLTTEIASDFYEQLGYVKEGLLKKHWWGQDFAVMSKVLD